MSSSDKKIEIILRSDELRGVLKALATSLKHSIAPDALRAFAGDIEHAQKLQLVLRQQGGLAELKLKVKGLPTPAEASEEAQEKAKGPNGESYKSIKKRLKVSFKFLCHSISTQGLPTAEIVESFLTDSKAMCEHPDRGGGDYARYQQLMAEFEAAFAEDDRVALAAICAEFSASKKSCHSLHK
jgi:hypothetical protein